MKSLIIIIFCSLFYGLISVNAQETETKQNKSEPVAKTELQSQDLRRANQPALPGEELVKPAPTKETISPEEQRALNGPMANEPDPTMQKQKSKASNHTKIDSDTQGLKANENPKKNY